MTKQPNEDIMETFSVGERNIRASPYSQQQLGIAYNHMPYPESSPIMHDESRQGSFDTKESWNARNRRVPTNATSRVGEKYHNQLNPSRVISTGGAKAPRSRDPSKMDRPMRQQSGSHSGWTKTQTSPGYTASDWNHMIKLLVHIQQPLPHPEKRKYDWNR